MEAEELTADDLQNCMIWLPNIEAADMWFGAKHPVERDILAWLQDPKVM
jgi:hypothetical protein